MSAPAGYLDPYPQVFLEKNPYLSDVQGFANLHGYTGKGTWGKGRDQGIGTLTKPLPSTQVGGYPPLFGRVAVTKRRNSPIPGMISSPVNGRQAVRATVI